MLIENSTLLAILLAIFGGIAAALYRYSIERKKPESTYDWVDVLIQSVTASFAGLLGFYAAHWKFDDPDVILVITGLASTAGYPMLIMIKDDAYLLVKSKLSTPVPGISRKKKLIRTPTYTGPDRRQSDHS